MKNVGGPIMNVMCSRSMMRSASSGSHRAISTDFIGTAPGSRTPFSRPEMCASGAGMRTASSGREPVHSRHQPRLVGQGAVGVDDALRAAARPGREQHDRGIGRRARDAPGGTGSPSGNSSPTNRRGAVSSTITSTSARPAW